MNILLLSSGGGGANILRSLKSLFERDVEAVQHADAAYAERLRRAITTRFLDTNEYSLAQVPQDERVLIGAGTTKGQGSRHNPELARRALDESRAGVEELMARHAVIVLIGTGGKGTGAGTMFPLADIARRLNKLVLPVFVRPSFERHEVDKRRYDHALRVASEFDAGGIRLIEILNDRGYEDEDPQAQSVVWERMNLPIARSLRGLLYVLWDLSQVDPSDLSMLLAGPGRMRIGFAEIAPAAAGDPSDGDIAEAVHRCWGNPYCAFSKPVGTSLICIQGDWSNLADAKIKGGLAALALADTRSRPYNPLYARAFRTPPPWGVTALFTEYTGVHEPIALDWAFDASAAVPPEPQAAPTTPAVAHEAASAPEPRPAPEPARAPDVEPAPQPAREAAPPSATDARDVDRKPARDVERKSARDADRKPARPPLDTLLEFAKALAQSDDRALALAAAKPPAEMAIEVATVIKLLGTLWFKSVFTYLSSAWRARLFDALEQHMEIPNHIVRAGRYNAKLTDLRYDQMKEIMAHTVVRGDAGAYLHLLLAIGQLWGEAALSRLRYVEVAEPEEAPRLGSFLGLRS